MSERSASWFVKLQNALPQHPMSRGLGALARSETPWVKNALIKSFASAYSVNLSEAVEENMEHYRSFNDFFTRALKVDARPMPEDDAAVVCPADGAISQFGTINNGRLLQAKGHEYSIQQLAGPLSNGFDEGEFLTVYLAPSDYHRVHLPCAGELTHSLAIPGALYSVNAATEQTIAGLFCRNERLVCRFNTDRGPMLVILVGALIVASIETVWPGPSSPYQREELTEHDLSYERGEEIGRFLLGSTVICCFAKQQVALAPELGVGQIVRMGQMIGSRRN